MLYVKKRITLNVSADLFAILDEFEKDINAEHFGRIIMDPTLLISENKTWRNLVSTYLVVPKRKVFLQLSDETVPRGFAGADTMHHIKWWPVSLYAIADFDGAHLILFVYVGLIRFCLIKLGGTIVFRETYRRPPSLP